MDASTPCEGYTELIARLDAAVKAADPEAITRQVKRDLEELIGARRLRLPERLRQLRPDCYARRLLHRDPQLAYTAVVMTWGHGQRTALHDHAGIWCVEGVIEGMMEVRRYDLVDEHEGLYRFSEEGRVTASVGSAGCLIPPFDYHILGNALEAPSITLHVYGGEMDHCHVFEPRPDGRYERQIRTLSYHD